MPAATILRRGSLSVIDYRCNAGPHDTPFLERHEAFSVSYVRTGSFGLRLHDRSLDLVAGSIMVGHPGDEFMCTHDHVRGDECLSFQLEPALVDMIGGRTDAWRVGCVPPLSELMVLGELGQAAAEGDRKSTRLNSSHSQISYAVFCLKKKKDHHSPTHLTG